MPWQVVQSANGTTATGSTSVSATFGQNLQAGNKIIACWTVSSLTSEFVTGVTDSNANALSGPYHRTASVAPDFADVGFAFLDVPAGDAGTTPAITAAFSGSASGSLVILEVAGLVSGDDVAVIDTGSTGQVNPFAHSEGTGTPTTSPVFSSVSGGEFLLTIYGDFGEGNTVTPDDPSWNVDPNSVNSSANGDCVVAYKSSSGGAESDIWDGAGTCWVVAETAFLVTDGAVQPTLIFNNTTLPYSSGTGWPGGVMSATVGANTVASLVANNAGQPGDGTDCCQVTASGRSVSNTNYWQWAGSWQQLGVPPGATVQSVQVSYWWRCTAYVTGAASTVGGTPNGLYDSGGVQQGSGEAGSTPYSSTTAWAHRIDSTLAVPPALQPSASSIQLRIYATQATGNSSSAANTLQFDYFQVIAVFASATAPPLLDPSRRGVAPLSRHFGPTQPFLLRPPVSAPQAATTIPQALTDTGAAADALALAADVPLTDSGTGDDSAFALSAGVPLADAGTGTDTLGVTATAGLTESGTAADSLAVTLPVPLADSGTGTDSLAVVVATAVSLTDSGSGSDALAIVVATAVPLADSGSGTDHFGTVLAAVSLAELGAAADTLAVSVLTAPFTVARSTPTVTAVNGSSSSVSATATSAPTVTDPRDGTSSITAVATSSPLVSAATTSTPGVS